MFLIYVNTWTLNRSLRIIISISVSVINGYWFVSDCGDNSDCNKNKDRHLIQDCSQIEEALNQDFLLWDDHLGDQNVQLSVSVDEFFDKMKNLPHHELIHPTDKKISDNENVVEVDTLGQGNIHALHSDVERLTDVERLINANKDESLSADLNVENIFNDTLITEDTSFVSADGTLNNVDSYELEEEIRNDSDGRDERREDLKNIPNERNNITQEEVNDETISSGKEQSDGEEGVTEANINSRKRKRNVNKWKKNVRKFRRNAGMDYVSEKGIDVLGKNFRFYECKCCYKCKENVPEDVRKQIHKDFYRLEDWKSQTIFIQGKITLEPVKRRRVKEGSTRNFTRHYFLPVDSNLKEVCKNVFRNTLRLSDSRTATALMKTENPDDMRGRHPPHNKPTEETVFSVKDFINKFPTYQSHYTRHKNPVSFPVIKYKYYV